MNSLASIESLIASETDPDVRTENLCRLGVALAQVGRIDEASRILEQLRAYLSSRYILRIVIRTMILEALIPYYQDFANLSDRLRRAHVLAVAADVNDLRAEVSVWLAHLNFNFDDFDGFGQNIRDALDRFSLLNYSHRARLVLAIADALQYLGDRKSAMEWYGVARSISRRAHDHGLMVAIEFNRVAMGLSHIRTWRALGRNDKEGVERNWLLELGSVRGLHHGFGAQALLEVLDLCDAHAMEVRESYLEAAQALTRMREAGGLHRCGVSERLIDLEIMWCRAKSGSACPSIDWIEQECDLVMDMKRNEKLVGMRFLSDIVAICGVPFDRAQFNSEILSLAKELDIEYNSLRAAVTPVLDQIALIRGDQHS